MGSAKPGKYGEILLIPLYPLLQWDKLLALEAVLIIWHKTSESDMEVNEQDLFMFPHHNLFDLGTFTVIKV